MTLDNESYFKKLLLLLIFVCSALQPAHTRADIVESSSESKWYGGWGVSSQRPPNDFINKRELNGQTIRQLVTVYGQGDKIRLRISNAFGTTPLHIGAASVALKNKNSITTDQTPIKVLFGGNRSITAPPGALILSDPLSFKITPPTALSISLFFPKKTPITTGAFGLYLKNHVSPPGNYVDQQEIPVLETINVYPFLTGIDVLSDQNTNVIVTLGDSLTQGLDGDINWPSKLAERLAKTNCIPVTSVINGGISGSTLMLDAENPNILARFDRDVLGIPGVSHIILLAGINDIGRPNSVGKGGKIRYDNQYSAQDIIAIYRQLIARAHEHGLMMYGGTLTPLGGPGAPFYSEEKQKIHTQVNQWIRSGEFDAVIDFSKAISDPESPEKISKKYDFGDKLHLNHAGLTSMAKAISPSLFKKPSRVKKVNNSGCFPTHPDRPGNP